MDTKEEKFIQRREQMVERQIEARGIENKAVIQAMMSVPRHRFVPQDELSRAYSDEPLSIGEGQTISQPYIVAFMTEQLQIDADDNVLEIGTGSGYQAAVLAEIADSVYTIEIIPELAQKAGKLLKELEYQNIVVKQGDGYHGWPEKAPFDAIIVTAAPPRIPQTLLEQLKIGGRMVLPVGEYTQELVVVDKSENGLNMQSILPVRFVPMTGEVQENE
ncbi:MAG: protein-L-isoaspartate(D-aspartate) O-methyltransferase [Caldithrix sp.]|nr:protein-L-isoaspartate(D-aspartate) O-methyltransferase [Caldithrix sp.]